jgi:ribosomal protein L32
MATPKKKVSKSRRNMRRFASGNQLDKPTYVVSPVDEHLTRPHRVTRDLIAAERHLEATASFKKKAAPSV